MFAHTLKEVVVWPPLVKIFNVVEQEASHVGAGVYIEPVPLVPRSVERRTIPRSVAGIVSLSARILVPALTPEPSLVVTQELLTRTWEQDCYHQA